MPIHCLIQLSSMAVTAWLFTAFPISTSWYALIFSLAFSHYLLSIVYSRRQIVQIAAQPHSIIAGLLVIAAGASLYLQHFPLYAYFGLHHAFNEVYIRRRLLPTGADTTAWRTSAVVLHLAVFVLVVRAQVAGDKALVTLMLIAIVVSALVYFRQVWRMRRLLTLQQFMDSTLFEIVVIALVPVAFFYRFTLEQLVCYHLIFWILYPTAQFVARRQTTTLLVYLVLTVVTIAGFLLVSPLGPSYYQVPVQTFYKQFILWSFIHITLSFALSAAHPDWITRWFRPRAAATQATN